MELFTNFIARQTAEEQLNRTSPKLQNVTSKAKRQHNLTLEKVIGGLSRKYFIGL